MRDQRVAGGVGGEAPNARREAMSGLPVEMKFLSGGIPHVLSTLEASDSAPSKPLGLQV